MATRYLSKQQAATYTSMSVAGIDKMISKKLLTPLHPLPGRTVIDRLEIDRVVKRSASIKSPRGGRLEVATA